MSEKTACSAPDAEKSWKKRDCEKQKHQSTADGGYRDAVCGAVTAAGSGADELSDRTGSSPFLWFALLFVIGAGALTVYGIAGKRKKPALSDTGKTE